MSFKGFVSCNGRISKEEKEFYDLKNKAAEYYRANGVPQMLEAVLNEMFFEKPNDICGYLANYFSRLSHTPLISAVAGREVYDSKGEAALWVDMYCIIRNDEKLLCSALFAAGNEDIAESGDALACGNRHQASVETAQTWIKEHLSSMLRNFNLAHQAHLDKLLSDFYMARYTDAQDAQNRERKSEQDEKTEIPPETTPPPALSQTKGKTKGEKGQVKKESKKGSATEKPLPPPELPVPVLPGAMAVAAVSLAAAKTASRLAEVSLYKHIINLRNPQGLSAVFMPIPLVTVLSCGKASAGKLNLLQEVILLPTVPQTTKQVIEMAREVVGEIRRLTTASGKSGLPVGVSEGGALQLSFDRPEQALDLLIEACANLSLPIGTELRLVINCAAHTLMDYPKGRYEVMAGTMKTPDELVDMLVGLINKYPAIAALIDPFRKEDVDQWQKLSSLISQSCCLIADAAHSPSPCWREGRLLPPGVTWVTLKHRSEMTLTDLLYAVTDRTEGETVFAVSSEEAGDSSMVDVAVGLGAAFIKLGGLSGGRRMNKYNRLLSIEQELQEQGVLAGMREVKVPCMSESEEVKQTEQATLYPSDLHSVIN